MTCTVDGTRKTDFEVQVGKTHEVVINNDKPDTPKKPDQPSKNKSVPKSGDESASFLWLGILALAALGIGTIKKNVKRG